MLVLYFTFTASIEMGRRRQLTRNSITVTDSQTILQNSQRPRSRADCSHDGMQCPKVWLRICLIVEIESLMAAAPRGLIYVCSVYVGQQELV